MARQLRALRASGDVPGAPGPFLLHKKDPYKGWSHYEGAVEGGSAFQLFRSMPNKAWVLGRVAYKPDTMKDGELSSPTIATLRSDDQMPTGTREWRCDGRAVSITLVEEVMGVMVGPVDDIDVQLALAERLRRAEEGVPPAAVEAAPEELPAAPTLGSAVLCVQPEPSLRPLQTLAEEAETPEPKDTNTRKGIQKPKELDEDPRGRQAVDKQPEEQPEKPDEAPELELSEGAPPELHAPEQHRHANGIAYLSMVRYYNGNAEPCLAAYYRGLASTLPNLVHPVHGMPADPLLNILVNLPAVDLARMNCVCGTMATARNSPELSLVEEAAQLRCMAVGLCASDFIASAKPGERRPGLLDAGYTFDADPEHKRRGAGYYTKPRLLLPHEVSAEFRQAQELRGLSTEALVELLTDESCTWAERLDRFERPRVLCHTRNCIDPRTGKHTQISCGLAARGLQRGDECEVYCAVKQEWVPASVLQVVNHEQCLVRYLEQPPPLTEGGIQRDVQMLTADLRLNLARLCEGATCEACQAAAAQRAAAALAAAFAAAVQRAAAAQAATAALLCDFCCEHLAAYQCPHHYCGDCCNGCRRHRTRTIRCANCHKPKGRGCYSQRQWYEVRQGQKWCAYCLGNESGPVCRFGRNCHGHGYNHNTFRHPS